MTPDQNKKLTELHEALCGNKTTDNPGLIARVKVLEAQSEKDKIVRNKFMGGLFISVPLITVFIEWCKHKLLNL